MKTKSILTALLIFLCLHSGYAQYTKTLEYDKEEAVPRPHNIDISNILIDVSFEPQIGKVSGTVTHTFIPIQEKVDSIFFDAPQINIINTTLDAQQVNFKTHTTGVSIHFAKPLILDKTYKIEIKYDAQPRLGLYFIGWNDTLQKSRKQIWTQGQAYDHRYWVPLFDKQNDKATTEVKVKFDAAYQVLSNGKKILEKLNNDGTKTWHYKLDKPHSPYLIMLGIGKYAVQSVKSKGGVPIQLWYYPEYPERVKPTYQYSAEMMDWFEQELGVKYPWGTYAQIPVQDYTFGAMENTTATLFGDFYLLDEGGTLDRAYLYVNAHELTHQWFGDLITERSETHHWLHENFATYYGNLFTGSVKGMDYYHWSRKTSIDQALEASKKDMFPIAHSKGGTIRHYPKGAVVLDMLRYTTGDIAFKRTMKYFLDKHAFQNVDSEDLLVAFHEKTGLSLDWFWEQWIFRGGEPKYEVVFQDLIIGKNSFSEFTITQTHEINELVKTFKMPIRFQVFYTNGTADSSTVIIDQQRQIVRVPNPNKLEVDYVLFDPNMQVMKSVTFNKPLNMLLAQAQKAQHMLDRYDALIALRAYALKEKQKVLQEQFYKEKFHATKAEIIAQLSLDLSNQANTKIVHDALKDTDVDVRKAALNAIKTFDVSTIPLLEQLLNDKSYVIVEQCLDKLCQLNPSMKTEYLAKTKTIVGTRGSNVKIKWLELKATDSLQVYGAELAVYAGRSYEFITRINAMNALKRLNYVDTNTVKGLIDAILNPNSRLSTEANSNIKHFMAQAKIKRMFESYVKSIEWKPWQKVILQKAGL